MKPLVFLVLAALAGSSFAQTPSTMRVAGNFSSNKNHVDAIERPFFTALPGALGAPMTVNYNPMDVVNVQAADALRLLRSGTFDVMSVQIGMASRDDPFFEGIDLIGVSTNMKDLRKAVDAYREAFDQRLQTKFKAKVLTLWPFGPQVFYCNKPIKSVDDIKGLKVRSFTPSMAALIQNLGGTPVTLQVLGGVSGAAARRG
jgi:TRAP-type C4-dicarboxylate transport system substrate-binding protein